MLLVFLLLASPCAKGEEALFVCELGQASETLALCAPAPDKLTVRISGRSFVEAPRDQFHFGQALALATTDSIWLVRDSGFERRFFNGQRTAARACTKVVSGALPTQPSSQPARNAELAAASASADCKESEEKPALAFSVEGQTGCRFYVGGKDAGAILAGSGSGACTAIAHCGDRHYKKVADIKGSAVAIAFTAADAWTPPPPAPPKHVEKSGCAGCSAAFVAVLLRRRRRY